MQFSGELKIAYGFVFKSTNDEFYGIFGKLKKQLAALGRPHLVGPIFEGAVSVMSNCQRGANLSP